MEENLSFIPSNESFRLLIDQSRSLIWASGTEKLHYFFNAAWLAYTSRAIEQEQGDGWTRSVHPDDLKKCLAAYNNAFETRNEFTRMYRLKKHDGSYHRIADWGTPSYRDGTFAGYAGFGIIIYQLLEDPKLKKDLISTETLQREQHLNEELTATNEELNAANEELTPFSVFSYF